MTKRQEQKEQTRQKILEAAYRTFSEKGFIGTRMTDIAERAEVAHGSLFVHFKTQDDLVSSVIEEYGRRIAGKTHELAGKGSEIREIAASAQVLFQYKGFAPGLLWPVGNCGAARPGSRACV